MTDDRGELIILMEPLLLGSRRREQITDLAFDLPRGDIGAIAGTGERQGRIVSALMDKGVLTSSNPRSPLRLVFPAFLAGHCMPGLFPEQAS